MEALVRKSLAMICLLAAAVGITGCGSSPDSLMQEQIKDTNELAEAIETKAPQDKINDLRKKMEENGKKLAEFKLSDDDKKKLVEKHKDEFTKATARLAKAMGLNREKTLENVPVPGPPAPIPGAEQNPIPPAAPKK